MMVPLQTADLFGIGTGPAILFVGLMALLLWACVTFRNPLGIIMWGLTMLLFVLSGLLEFPVDSVWVGVALTVIMVVIGVAVRLET